MFKEHQVFITVPIVSTPISSPVVYQHPITTSNNEPIEEVTYKLQKSIYSLKQASNRWYLMFDEVFTANGFKDNIIDQCIFMKVSGSNYIFLVLYVDDILLTSNDIDLLV